MAFTSGHPCADLTPYLKCPVLVAFSDVGGNLRSSVTLKLGYPRVEIQEFLGSSELPETKLLLLSCGTVPLFDEIIAAGGRHDLLVVDLLKRWKFSDGVRTTGQLVGANRLWNVEFAEQASQERSRGFGITVALQRDVKNEAMLIHSSPEPVSDASSARADLVHMLSGFLTAEILSEEGPELHAPLAEGFVADHNAAMAEQFLNISVTEGQPMVEPNGVLDDRHRESVAVGLGVGYGGSGHPNPAKAT